MSNYSTFLYCEDLHSRLGLLFETAGLFTRQISIKVVHTTLTWSTLIREVTKAQLLKFCEQAKKLIM